MENFYEILPVLKTIIASLVGLGTFMTLIAKLIPNNKLYRWGFNFGKKVGAIGFLKMGENWEKIEDFLINSIGKLLEGTKDGLNSDDDDPNNTPDESEDNTEVRV